MTHKKVDVNEAISYGWKTVTKDLWYFVGIAVVTSIIMGIGSTKSHYPDILSLIGLLLSAWLTAGYLKLFLSYYGDKKLPFGDLFSQTKYFGRVLGASVLIALIVFVGLIFLIIPGVYLAIRYQFVPILIVDKDISVFDAMMESSNMTRGVMFDLFMFMLVSVAVMFLGVLALGVGVFVAMPVVWLAHIYIYKNLEKK